MQQYPYQQNQQPQLTTPSKPIIQYQQPTTLQQQQQPVFIQQPQFQQQKQPQLQQFPQQQFQVQPQQQQKLQQPVSQIYYQTQQPQPQQQYIQQQPQTPSNNTQLQKQFISYTPNAQYQVAGGSGQVTVGGGGYFQNPQLVLPRFVQSTMPQAEICAILADIGGTNSRFSLKKFNKDTQQIAFEKSDIVAYNTQSKDFASFYAILDKFFKEEAVKSSIQPTIAILSFAGPPKNGEVVVSNSPPHWPKDQEDKLIPIKSQEILKQFPSLKKCIFLNDFEAIGYAFSKKEQLDLFPVHKCKGKTDNQKYPMAVLGPGTGLGECIINPVPMKNNTQEYFVFATEGGHATFAPITQEEFEFTEFIRKEKNLSYVCNEVAFAGPAIPYIYKFFRHKSHEHNKIEHQLNELKHKKESGEIDEPTYDSQFNQMIVQNGINEHDPVCYQTIKFLVKIMVTEIGNFGIRAIARDGVFIVGSLINSLDNFIEKHYDEIFKPVYFNKDKMIPLLEEIPVYIVKTNELGLRGCFCQAQKYAFEN